MANYNSSFSGEQIDAKLRQIDSQQESINNLYARNTFYTNINVPVANWSTNATYSEYPYRAAIALDGITASYYPEVIFNITEANSGTFAPVCETYNGGIYLYAKYIPLASITIPTIKCTYNDT